MKLKAKKSLYGVTAGKVYSNVIIGSRGNDIVVTYHNDEGLLDSLYYDSFDKLAEWWESYIEPAEPLIKDEKIRKAVRAWYDAIDYRIDNLLCIKGLGNTRLEISDATSKLIYISLFVDKGTLANIKDRTYYTIAELCGEEEK